jgi:hypothetical protein
MTSFPDSHHSFFTNFLYSEVTPVKQLMEQNNSPHLEQWKMP